MDSHNLPLIFFLIFVTNLCCTLANYLAIFKIFDFLAENHQRIKRQEKPSTLCANRGQFLTKFCVSDYDCSNGEMMDTNIECIRGHCCTKTSIPKSQVNARQDDDLKYCSNGGFFMNKKCLKNDDCNNDDPHRTRRPFPLQVCLEKYCCSSVYKRPQKIGDLCLNGGKFLGNNCNFDSECEKGAKSVVCIDEVCCTRIISSAAGFDKFKSENDAVDRYDADEDRGGTNVCANYKSHFTKIRCRKVKFILLLNSPLIYVSGRFQIIIYKFYSQVSADIAELMCTCVSVGESR